MLGKILRQIVIYGCILRLRERKFQTEPTALSTYYGFSGAFDVPFAFDTILRIVTRNLNCNPRLTYLHTNYASLTLTCKCNVLDTLLYFT